jgi:hypothetical protein
VIVWLAWLWQNGMRWLESTYSDRARAWVGFNESVSHRITAAVDLLLMPSRFEPCGLNQVKPRGVNGRVVATIMAVSASSAPSCHMHAQCPLDTSQLYAMRYGTVPVAHATGGLKDTVLNFDPFQVDPAPKSAAPAVVALQQQGICALALCSDLICDVSLLHRCAMTVLNMHCRTRGPGGHFHLAPWMLSARRSRLR